jgi:uridine phosphorylase
MARERPPILDFPGTGHAVIDPARLNARKERIPDRVVMTFFLDLLLAREARGELRLLRRLRGEGHPTPVYAATVDGREIAVAFAGIGAPFAASLLEELIGLGGRHFVVCGGAGVLDGTIPPGEILLPTAALRGEGTSYHYQRSGATSRPHAAAVKVLREVCREAGVPAREGLTWTTDGVYRETPTLVKRRRRQGCIAVEMEAAALFAVARFRKVVLGQLLYAGDDVSGETWNHRRWNQLGDVRETLLELSAKACLRLP